MSPIDESFSFEPEATVAAVLGSVGLDGEFRLSAGRAFFEGKGLIAIDSDKRLHCLSRNPTLKLEAISSSSSSSSSQIIGGTNRLTPTSALSLEDEENGDDDEDEANNEDKEAGSGVLGL